MSKEKTKGTRQEPLPVQAVPEPILCNPYEEPTEHWIYSSETGDASRGVGRRPASYWYKTERTGSAQMSLLAEEERDDLPLVNLLREDVRKWREAGYPGATNVTRDLLRHWARTDRARRLFFCQREAVETVIYLLEIRIPGKVGVRGTPGVSKDDLGRLLRGERPGFGKQDQEFYPRLVDAGKNGDLAALRRMACKMATGSGKTVVMAMLAAWAFCNRGQNPATRLFPNGVLVCCPNTIGRERLQVLRPEVPNNYYAAFDIVPMKYRPLLQAGKVLVVNWHRFMPESEHNEGGKNYAVVNKGPETPDSFARRVLDDLYDRLPILVFNDEAHHCWRPAETVGVELEGEEKKALEEEVQEARVWLEGLDQINNCTHDPAKESGISMCVDLSATPFYLKGSGHPEGRPFPWIVSDFGLVDAIESGIVKIPRLPVQDTTGRPDPKYFRLWKSINEDLEPGERLPGKGRRPKPEVVYREAEGALMQIAAQWKERYEQMEGATPGQENVPPVLILVCDNTDIAEVFYRKISGETEEDVATEQEVVEAMGGEGEESEEAPAKKGKGGKKKTKTVYGHGAVFPELFSNTAERKRTIRIDSKLLAEAESEDPKKKKSDAAEALKQVVSTVGKPGQPGEHVRCVVSVSMLTEGWDANNVTQILGVRAFGSQLLCEQVVGRGLRRMDYVPDPKTGLLTEEYVDVYGIPFSVIPFKGRPVKGPAPDDRPKNHVRSLPERSEFEMRFPVVEGYAFALKKNMIRCDVGALEGLRIEPNREPTATFVRPTVGYQEGPVSAGVDFKTPRPCHATERSQINQVVLDTMNWEAGAAFRLEASKAVAFYARNDHLELVIPYEFMGISHTYEPDFLVRLKNGVTVLVEVKGYEDEQTKAKHAAARRWVEAVNNWGQLGRWSFHVCRNPQVLEKELRWLGRLGG